MQKRIGKVLSISIISAACFALPVSSWAQSKPSDATGAPTTPETNKRGAAADKTGAKNKKDAPVTDTKQENPSNNAEPTPAK